SPPVPLGFFKGAFSGPKESNGKMYFENKPLDSRGDKARYLEQNFELENVTTKNDGDFSLTTCEIYSKLKITGLITLKESRYFISKSHNSMGFSMNELFDRLVPRYNRCLNSVSIPNNEKSSSNTRPIEDNAGRGSKERTREGRPGAVCPPSRRFLIPSRRCRHLKFHRRRNTNILSEVSSRRELTN
ncbi:hypothetical protein PENTCL1PPCAC_1082, partial [Pristionchus entomophagus]